MRIVESKLRNHNGYVVDEFGEATCARCGAGKKDVRRAGGTKYYMCYAWGTDYESHIWKWQLEESEL